VATGHPETTANGTEAQTAKLALQCRKPRATANSSNARHRIIIRVSGVRVPPPASHSRAKSAAREAALSLSGQGLGQGMQAGCRVFVYRRLFGPIPITNAK
jgi:hypothetical protein